MYSAVPFFAVTNSLLDLKNKRLSALEIVVRRWAIIIIVKPEPCFAICSIAPYTSSSDLGSRAEVASSKIRIFGFLIKALAIAIRYF